ncbi:phospholipid scramblase 2-like isoform X3 [Ornithodoros turicata]|uniref:phospholipid scramblase 2-like isoform X3 n=1 Tax=Ornithodoros turicata TaxID=34597 RepID=UPI003139B675
MPPKPQKQQGHPKGPTQQQQGHQAAPARSRSNTNSPSGLEYLGALDQLIIKQQVELLEAFTGFETGNKYIACNNQGQQVYFLAESSNICTRCCCDEGRCFSMNVMDTQKRQVMKFIRPLRCQSNYRGLCCCCLQVRWCDTGGRPPYQKRNMVSSGLVGCTPRMDTQWSGHPTLSTTMGDEQWVEGASELVERLKEMLPLSPQWDLTSSGMAGRGPA